MPDDCTLFYREEGIPAVGSTAPKMSLDQFMARHTSEDNASFKEILAGINNRRRERYAWAHREKNADEVFCPNFCQTWIPTVPFLSFKICQLPDKSCRE